MKSNRRTIRACSCGIVLTAVLLALPSVAPAAVWTNTAGGNWSTEANWSGGIPNAADAVADFSQLNLPANVTVTVDGQYTLGTIIFGNSNPSPANSWIITNSGSPSANFLTLDSSSTFALITVNNLGLEQSATIGANMAGSSPLMIDGPGTLILAGSNSYSGGTTLTNSATLILGAANSLPANTVLTLGDINNHTTRNAINLQVLNSQTVGGLITQGGVSLTNIASAIPTNFITIPLGQTLTVNGNVILGTNSASGTNASLLNISGAGSLFVNDTNGIFRVAADDVTSTAAGTETIADMSGLATANIYLGTNISGTSAFCVGDFSTSGPGGVVPSTCLLASNTTITANTLALGTSRRYNAETLLLGTGSNVFNVNSNLLGTNLDYGQVYFGANTGTIRVRAADGASRSFLAVSWGNGISTALGASNQFWDCGANYADLYLTDLQVGYDRKAGYSSNYFGFANGILDTTELDVGIQPNDPPANSPHLWHNVCNLGGGTVNIGTNGIVMGVGGGQNPASTSTNWHELNISGGSNTVNGDIMLMAQKATNSANGGNEMNISTLNITGGMTTVNGNIYCCKYTTNPGPHISTLTLNGGTLDLTGHFIGSVDCVGQSGNFNHTPRVPWWVDVINLQAGTLRNVQEINGGAVNTVAGIMTNLVKTGPGILTLAGSNTYTGGTLVSNGTLVALNNGALGRGNLVLAGGTTLILGSATLGEGYTFAVDDLNISNATLHLNLDGSAPVTNLVTATVSASGPNIIVIDSVTNISGSMLFPLISYTGADPFAGFSPSVSLPVGYTGVLIDNTTNQTVALSIQVPILSPSTTTLTSTAISATSGQALTLSAAVAGTNGAPAGTVNFYAGPFWFGSAPLNEGVAALVTSALPVGTNSVIAIYGGDVNYNASASSNLLVTINLASPAIEATPPARAGATNLALAVNNTASGYDYFLETTYTLSPPITWKPLLTNIGNGQALTNLIPVSKNAPEQYFRYRVWAASSANSLPLMNKGKANAVIVIGPAATSVEQFAASELQSYLSQITGGQQFAILSSSQVVGLPATNEIVIGQPESNPLVAQLCAQYDLRLDTNILGYDGYVLDSFSTSTNTIILLSGSNNRSSLFAVYHLLETLGVRFYGYKSRNGEIVPSLSSPVIPALNIVQTPVMTYRFVSCNNYAPTNAVEVAEVADWGAKNRCNAFMLTPVYPGESWSQIDLADVQKRGMLVAGPGHILAQLTPSTNLFATHPEYFPLINGVRNMEYSATWGGAVSFCYNNAMSIVVSNTVAYYEQNPFIDLLAIWPPDGSQHSVQCQDSVCSQRTESEWYLTMLNEIDQALSKLPTHPKLVWIAYDELSVPPADTAPYNNGADFILNWCNQIRTFGYPMNSPSNMVAAQYLQWNTSLPSICTDWKSDPTVYDLASYYRWQTWSNYLASCNYRGQTMLLDYYNANVAEDLLVPMLGFCQTGPWPNNLMQTDFEFYVGQGILGWQNCTDYYNDFPHWSWNWLSAQLMWNPWANTTALDQDFYSQLFGPASSVMQTYFTNLWPDIALANISVASSNNVAALSQYLTQASAIAAKTNNAVLNYWLKEAQSFQTDCLSDEGQNILNYNQDGSPK